MQRDAPGPQLVDLTQTRRRRRPTGTPAPLPKSIGLTGWLWVAAVLIIVVSGCIWLHVSAGPLDRFDAAIARPIVALRTDWLDPLASTKMNSIGSRWGLAGLGLAVAALAIVFRRFRHLIVFLVSLALLHLALDVLIIVAARVRPLGVTQIADWEGYAAPSLPTAVLTAVLIGFAFMHVVPGKLRWYAKLATVFSIAAVGLLRVSLGIEHPTDVVFGAILGVAIPIALFRAFVPNDAFPVRYKRRGKAAHLDVSGQRGDAIRRAMQEQLGFTVLEMKPVGLEASGGSTPLKLTVIDEHGDERSIFVKLYAKNHVRADRWYKLGRAMLYGGLEDETPFKTVRRFVEYEDYALRLLGEYGFPTPAPLGVVEITPEREYLIAMEFFEDAEEIGSARVDDPVIDEGLQLIRRLWNVGLAHRDIKPANLMVQDGHLRLIDVFFVQVRPSPWRQAVDLANMMLVLALRSDAETVYGQALEFFTPEELAEAFAATRGVASPTQLRSLMKQDRPALLEEFRALAPPRRPIPIQRWSFRRVGLIALSLLIVVFTALFSVGLFFPSRGQVQTPSCGTDRAMILMAQAVPSATKLPCIHRLPLGWQLSSATIVRGRATITMGVGGGTGVTVQVGRAPVIPLVEVTLSATCPRPGGTTGTRRIRVEGGCIVYSSSVPPSDAVVPSFHPEGGLALMPRSTLVSFVARQERLRLCGADVACT
jgi:tRNA A-37 threonylcarbamoyl transferase component Bud32/membrane-associated phospholipid phosphatase